MFPELLINGDSVQVQSEFSFGVNTDVSDILCTTKVSYFQGEKLLLTAEAQCFFSIREEEGRHIKDQGFIEVDFLRYLATIATGTMRGIIHAKTESTALNPVVLPPLNLVEAIRENLVFKTKSKTE